MCTHHVLCLGPSALRNYVRLKSFPFYHLEYFIRHLAYQLEGTN